MIRDGTQQQQQKANPRFLFLLCFFFSEQFRDFTQRGILWMIYTYTYYIYIFSSIRERREQGETSRAATFRPHRAHLSSEVIAVNTCLFRVLFYSLSIYFTHTLTLFLQKPNAQISYCSVSLLCLDPVLPDSQKNTRKP